MNFKKSQLFINIIIFERVKSIFIKNIYFASYWTPMPVVAAPLAVPRRVAGYFSKYFV